MANKTSAIDYVLVVDSETTGMHFGTPDPAISGTARYEAISWGLIVIDGKTLEEIDSMYIEIQPSAKCIWNDRAEEVHGLSRAYLAQNGKTRDEAIADIAEFIYKYFPPENGDNIVLAGQNVASFDRYFLKELFNSYDLPLKLSHRSVDTFSIGYATFGFTDSNQLFEAFRCRDSGSPHNALTDARAVLHVMQTVRKLITAMSKR